MNQVRTAFFSLCFLLAQVAQALSPVSINVRSAGHVCFESGEAKLTGEAIKTLANLSSTQARVLDPSVVSVVGFGDKLGATSPEQGLSLGMKRAQAVKDYLEKSGAIERNRIYTHGRPAAEADQVKSENLKRDGVGRMDCQSGLSESISVLVDIAGTCKGVPCKDWDCDSSSCKQLK